MQKVVILDTNILCVWLQVPGKETCGSGENALDYEKVMQKINLEIENKSKFVLPIAVIVETGNFITNAKVTWNKREIAQKFRTFVEESSDGLHPWVSFTNQSLLWDAVNLKKIVDVWFNDNYYIELGLADVSILFVADFFKDQNIPTEIYSADEKLRNYAAITRKSKRRERESKR